VQRAVQAAADEQVPREDPFQAATAINSVEPGTGKIKAMAVNRYYSEQSLPGHSKVNLATGGSSGMQAGSTFKPFILTAALQQGIPLGLDIYSPNRYISDVFEGYDDEGNLVPYSLSNAGDSETGGGTYDLRTGTWQSVNTFYVQLQERTGIEQPAALAEAMGLKWFKGGSPSEPLQRVPSFVLGVNEISPLSLAAAYATYPAHGRFCPATAVLEVLDAAGQPLELTQEPCRQVMEPEIADTVTSVLQGVVERGTARGADIGRPAAGKTGSTNESRGAWFAGFTPELTTTVWVGKPIPVPMKRVTINGRFYRQVYGGTLPARIWQQGMGTALASLPPSRFARVDSSVGDGDESEVPDVRGLPYQEARDVLRSAGFGTSDGGRVSGSRVGRGGVAYTSPRAGRTVSPGETITIFTSNGR
jgi:membrane peptidoglycan carboxypeptidase